MLSILFTRAVTEMLCHSPTTSRLNSLMSGVIGYMGPFLKSGNCEYILVAVDYVSKWVEDLPCRSADSRHSKLMFETVIFPRFGAPRMVVSCHTPKYQFWDANIFTNKLINFLNFSNFFVFFWQLFSFFPTAKSI